MAANEPDVGWSEAAMLCYLADGQLDVALDILDRESAKGRISRSWFYVSRLPWWEPLKDDPRFLDLVERMEGMLDEQRALLN